MKQCPNCHSQVNDTAQFCPVCGTALDTIPTPPPYTDSTYTQQPQYAPPVPAYDPYDHTKEFEAGDVSANKLVCMLVYLLDIVGIVVALLAAKESPYVSFHIKQAMKYTVAEVLLSLATLLLCWTLIVPILGGIALVILMICKIISFAQVCQGKAKEPVLLRNLAFLK